MVPKQKRVAFYLRVSTGGHTVENQRQELAKATEQRGVDGNRDLQRQRLIGRQRPR